MNDGALRPSRVKDKIIYLQYPALSQPRPIAINGILVLKEMTNKFITLIIQLI